MSIQPVEKNGLDNHRNENSEKTNAKDRLLAEVFADKAPDKANSHNPLPKPIEVTQKNVESTEAKADKKIDAENFLDSKEKEMAKTIAHAVLEGDAQAIQKLLQSATTLEERQQITNAVAAAHNALEGSGVHMQVATGSRMNGSETSPHDFIQLTVYQEGSDKAVEFSSDMAPVVGGPVTWKNGVHSDGGLGLGANAGDVLRQMGHDAVVQSEGLDHKKTKGNHLPLSSSAPLTQIGVERALADLS